MKSFFHNSGRLGKKGAQRPFLPSGAYRMSQFRMTVAIAAIRL